MNRLTLRQRALFGGLALTGLVWAVDALSGRSGPAPLQAAQATPTAETAAVPEPNVAQLVAQLTQAEYASVADELERSQRDLFVPTTQVEAAYAVKEGAPVAETPEHPGLVPAAASEPAFSAQHRLLGVLIGAKPLAVLDGHVLPLQAELEGYRLVRIERDYVLFRHTATGQTVRVELEPPPDKR